MSEEAEKTIDFSGESDISDVAAQAIADPAILAALIENLGGGSRRVRQFCAAALNAVSEERVDLLKPYVAQLSDALFRPEAQTRWQVLECIKRLIPEDPKGVEQACAGAESCLYDEDSGIVRLHGFRFFTVYAASSEEHAEQVWPLIDESIQCYHGDPEFTEMLNALLVLATETTSKPVKKAIADRMAFDATSGRGGLKHRAQQIIDAAKA